MSLPREVLPGRFYLITRRCLLRYYLLRPDDKVNQAFEYCLGVAAAKSRIEILGTCAMSNHHHTVIFDRHGSYPEFLEYFHQLLARCLNRYRGRRESFWSADQVSVVRLHGPNAIIAKLAYVALNPVAAHLVERAHEWPGVNSYRNLLASRAVTVKRPSFFFRKDGNMPASVTIEYAIPPEAGDVEAIRRAVQERVENGEARLREERQRTKRRVLGASRVKTQDWSESPRTEELRRDISPTFAAPNKWKRMEIILHRREFLAAYRDARRAWLEDRYARVTFPSGTYWLKRFANVSVPD